MIRNQQKHALAALQDGPPSNQDQQGTHSVSSVRNSTF